MVMVMVVVVVVIVVGIEREVKIIQHNVLFGEVAMRLRTWSNWIRLACEQPAEHTRELISIGFSIHPNFGGRNTVS